MLKPHFLDTPDGRLFCLEVVPDVKAPSKFVVLVPSFAEEMNKSRHMMALLGQSLSAQGIGFALFDFSGTGDSEGALEHSSFVVWRRNFSTYLDYLRDSYNAEIQLLCLRSGALVALGDPSLVEEIRTLHLWNPVLNGKQFIGQFFRTRLAAEMMKKDTAKITMKDLEAEMSEKGVTEIAGYGITGQLYADFSESLVQPGNLPGQGRQLVWYEINSQPKESLMPVSVKALEAFTEAGWVTEALNVQGDTFWATQEISVAPQAIEALVARVAGSRDGNL